MLMTDTVRNAPILPRWAGAGPRQRLVGHGFGAYDVFVGRVANEGGPARIASSEFDLIVEQYQLALGEFMKGNPEPVQELHSHREDVTLANPRVGIAHEWEEVAKRMEGVASGRREGEMSFEIVEKHVTPELAYLVEMERAKAKFGASEDVTSYALRTTVIFRPEDGTWKVVHRHADPLSSFQPMASYEVE